MTKYSGKNAIVLINGYNFSTFASSFETMQDAGKIDVTGFTDGSQNFIPGLPSATINANLFWDSTANSVHAALASPTTGNVTIMPLGYTLGNPTLSMPFMQGNYSPNGTPTGAVTVGTLAFESYGGTSRGVENGQALAHATITNTTTGTGFIDESGAAVTAVCSGTLHIWTPCAADTYAVTIEHSDSLATGYSTLITFTLNGSARASERIVVASGSVKPYRRVVATRTGAAGNQFGYSVHFAHA
jgi:hypothetical protein